MGFDNLSQSAGLGLYSYHFHYITTSRRLVEGESWQRAFPVPGRLVSDKLAGWQSSAPEAPGIMLINQLETGVFLQIYKDDMESALIECQAHTGDRPELQLISLI